jgi:non-ribosomal peptide synthetase-like protein
MSVTMFFFTAVYFIAVDRAVTALGKLQPRFCSIYDRDFWRHERFWKVPAMTYVAVFNGTPFKGLIWRLLGVRAGKRVFDDGCWMTERTLVTIGDGCTLNAGATIQSHSLEDGTFKSDHITIGDGVTLGINAFVHYGVTMGAGAVLEPDAFLMKGEDVPPHARWRGNPATQATAAPRSRPALAAAPAAAPQEPAETAPPVRVRLAKAPVAKARPRRRRRRPHRSARL